MAKLITYDNTGVEEGGGGTGVKAKPGVRIAKIARCTHRESNKKGEPANDLEVALNVGDEYDWVFTYVGLNAASDWKLAEFTRALELPEKGKLDPDKLVGRILRVKLNHGTYDGEYRPEAGRMFKAQPGDEENFGSQASELSSNGSGPVEEDSDGAFDPTREDPSDEEIGSYDDWEEADLLAEASDRDLTLPGGRGSKKDKAIKALREDDEAQGETGDTPAEEDSYTPEYADGFEASRESDPEIGKYEDWAEADLLAEVSDRGLSLPGGRGGKKDKAIKALREEDELVEGGGTETSSSEDGDDNYDDWDVDRLKQEATERSLEIPSFRGSGAADRLKTALVAALREDDGESPFA